MTVSSLDDFSATLSNDRPPDGMSPVLEAIWHAMRGDWDRAHGIVQEIPSREAAWVHAWLHRIEGDLANAAYWYRRAGRPAATGGTEAEGRNIAASLLGG